MVSVNVIGIRCGRPFDDIVAHFQKMGGDVALMNPRYVCGRDHILSAVMHAERAFLHGTNRSRTLLTETILYSAGERQISRALKKMRPEDGCNEMVAVVFNVADLNLEMIGAVADDRILRCTKEKAKDLGLDVSGDVSPEDLVLETVAVVDIQKQ